MKLHNNIKTSKAKKRIYPTFNFRLILLYKVQLHMHNPRPSMTCFFFSVLKVRSLELDLCGSIILVMQLPVKLLIHTCCHFWLEWLLILPQKDHDLNLAYKALIPVFNSCRRIVFSTFIGFKSSCDPSDLSCDPFKGVQTP